MLVTASRPDSAHSLRSDCPSIAARNSALARWSLIGVPSPASTSAAASTVSAAQGRPSSAASVASARIGVAATPPSPIRAFGRRRRRRRARSRWPRDEMSSKGRLAILWNAVSVAGRQRHDHLGDQLARAAYGLAVAGEVVRQRHGPLPSGRGEHDATPRGRAAPAARRRSASRCRGCRRGWRRCGSAARRTAASAPPAAAAGRPSRRSISVRVSAAPIRISSVADREAAQLRQPVDGDHGRGPRALEVDLDAPVGAAGDDDRVRVARAGAAAPRPGRRADERRLAVVAAGSAAGAGAGAVRRAASASSAAGKPSAYAASLIGR